MKNTIFATCLIVLLGCEDKPPTGPPPTQPSKQIVTAGYATYLDSQYFKQWSDSSWERYDGWISHEGVNYVVLLYSNGTRRYYSTYGYAGFKGIADSNITFFEQPIGELPDTMTCSQVYPSGTNYYYQGEEYHASYQLSLYDTVSVSLPVGVFSSCLWTKAIQTISVNNIFDVQTNYVWVAQGPGDIKKVSNVGDTTVMAYGTVNGQSWGAFP